MLTNCLKFQNRNVQTFGFVYHDTNDLNPWSNIEDPVIPLERNLYGHPLAGLLWERQFEKILLKHDWDKVPNWECLFVHREKRLFLSVYVDDIKMAGKIHHIDPMWIVLNNEVDLGEPTFFFDHVYLGCAQKQCEIGEDMMDNHRTMFESRISAGWTEKLPYSEIIQRYCELVNKTTQQLYKVSTRCIDDDHFKEEEICWRIVASMLSNSSKMFILDTDWKTWYFIVSE